MPITRVLVRLLFLGKSEDCSEKRERSSHRVTKLAAWRNDEKMEKTVLGIQ